MNNKHLYSFQTTLDNSVLVASTTPFLHDFSKHTKHHFHMDMEREKSPDICSGAGVPLLL